MRHARNELPSTTTSKRCLHHQPTAIFMPFVFMDANNQGRINSTRDAGYYNIGLSGRLSPFTTFCTRRDLLALCADWHGFIYSYYKLSNIMSKAPLVDE